MMDYIKNRKNAFISVVCILLLVFIGIIYTDAYKQLPMFRNKTITIGIFSDSYWEVQNGYSYRILEDAIDIFEKEHPEIQVDYVSGILKKDYSKWLVGQLLSDTAPDIFFVLAEDFNDIAEIGALKDLTPLITEDESFQKDSFYSSAYEYGKYHGTQYSLPYECAPKLMFVNQSILNKEGISISNEDWTWEEFYDICKKVTKDTNGDGVIDQFGTVGYTWEDAFDSNGIKLFNQDGTICYLTNENVEDALVFIEELEGINEGYNIGSNDFDLGNVVFQPMLFSEYRAYKPYPLSIKKYSTFEWDCIPMPAGVSGENISTLNTLLIAMNENTRNAEYA
ncbi:MAG: ABC transporter substrate-binding protein, partial [Anaerotignaceae bacterium]